MGLKNLFKRKPKVVEPTKEEKKELLLTEIIAELRKIGYSDEQIQKQFKDKNYPKEFIDYLLKLNEKQEVKQMAKEKVEEDVEEEKEFDEDEDMSEEDEEEEDSEETEDEDLEEETPKKKKVVSVSKVEKKPKEESKPELTLESVAAVLQTVIQNQNDLAQRLQSIEATLYRMRSA